MIRSFGDSSFDGKIKLGEDDKKVKQSIKQKIFQNLIIDLYQDLKQIKRKDAILLKV